MNHFRGHPIVFRDGEWIYEDTGEPTASTWESRPCGHCGQPQTAEGHDGCLGTLSGVMNACCGHGIEAEAYVQFLDGRIIHGSDAVVVFAESKQDQSEAAE